MIFDRISRFIKMKMGPGRLFSGEKLIAEVASGSTTRCSFTIPRSGITSRSIARSMAKANMKRTGIRRINRSFASNWRNWVRR